MRWTTSWAMVGTAMMLVACGGGDSSGGMPVDVSKAPMARADATYCATAPADPGPGPSYREIDGQCYQTLVLGPGKAQKADAQTGTISATSFFDWAEGRHPSLFPTREVNRTTGDGAFTYRFYQSTEIALAVNNSTTDIYALGTFNGWRATPLGNLATFNCTVFPGNCPTTTASVPGAPTIGTATAGNTTATVAFTAPASNGGATITSYTASCAAASTTRTGTATASPITVASLTNGTAYSCSVTATNSAGTSAASGSVSVTPVASTTTTTSTSGTAGVACAINSSVFIASLNMTSTAAMTCSSTQRTMTGNGLPDHTPGTFPNSANPTAISAQTVSTAMTLSPVKNASSTAVVTVGYGLNTVKFDPGTNAHCTGSGTSVTCTMNGAGTWSIEALGHNTFDLGLDSSNAHVQPGGIYHYHGMPEGLITRQNKGAAMTLVGFAVDGFPVYARYGYTTATSATSAIKTISGSYRLKTTADSGRPSTTSYPMGTFRQDYEYVANLNADGLDACNGRFGVTPEFPSGIYHYYITDTYPYIGRCVYGTATTTR